MLQLLRAQSLLGEWGLLQATGAFILFTPVIFFVSLAIKYRYFDPLSKFPGPFWASITPLYAMWTYKTMKEHILIEELHRKYGPIVRYQPNSLMFADPKMIPVIHNRRANKAEAVKSNLLSGPRSTALCDDYKDHAVARRRVAGPYSMSVIRRMESTIDAYILEFMDSMDRRYAQTGTKMDFAAWAQYFAYDGDSSSGVIIDHRNVLMRKFSLVISRIAFGRSFGFMETGSDVHTLIKSFHIGLAITGLIGKSEWILKAFRLLTPNFDDNIGVGRLIKERDRLVDERVKSKGSVKETDLMQLFLDAKNADGSPMTIGEVKAELLTVMFAGSDTTAATLRAILIHVLQTPGCYEKLIAEIDGFVKSNPECSVISYDDAQNLKYLTACIKESLRYTPAVPRITPRHPLKGGMTLEDGRYIPEDAKLAVTPHVTLRNKEIYGEDAQEFNPERWLESEGKVKNMEKYDISFGAGTRVCLGKNIAYLELWKGTFEFFRRYKPTLVAPEEIKALNMGILVHYDIWINIEKRG